MTFCHQIFIYLYFDNICIDKIEILTGSSSILNRGGYIVVFTGSNRCFVIVVIVVVIVCQIHGRGLNGGKRNRTEFGGTRRITELRKDLLIFFVAVAFVVDSI